MAHERAGLNTVNLADFHQPLPPRERVEALDAETSERVSPFPPGSVKAAPKPPQRAENVVELYPSLARAPKEHLIPFSIRLPLSQIEALDKLRRERGIPPSDLVRDFIARGLGDVKAAQ